MGRTIRTTTAAQPAPDPKLRAKVREALALLKDGRRATLTMLLEMVNDLIAEPCDVWALQHALEWNISKTFVGSWTNADLDREEYYITAAGRVKERQG